LLQYQEIPLSQMSQIQKKLKTSFVIEYLEDLRKGSKPELGALRSAFFEKHGTFIAFLLGDGYEITSETNRLRTWPDIFIVKKDFQIKVELELKQLYYLDKRFNRIVKSKLNPELYRDEIRNYLESVPFVILTNLEYWFLYSYKNFIKTGEIEPIKKWLFKDFVRNIQNMGFFEFILRETTKKKEELGKDFFKDLNVWLDMLKSQVEVKPDFIKQTKEIFIQLLNKLIFIQTLSDFALIDFNFLEESWNFWDKMYGKRDKRKVVKNFLETMVNEFHYTFYNTELFNFSVLEKIKDTKKNFDNLYESIKTILGVSSKKMSYQDFTGLISYQYIFIDEDIFGKSYENYLVKKQKEEGIYYTPNHIRNKIINETIKKEFFHLKDQILDLLRLKTLNNENLKALDLLLKRIISIKILDPACGSGSFLINALDIIWSCYQIILSYASSFKEKLVIKYRTRIDKLVKDTHFIACSRIEEQLILNERERISKIILRHIFGKDIDKNALNVAKVNLWLKALKLAPAQFKKSELEKDMKNEHILPNLETNLIKGNSLIGLSYEDFVSFLDKDTQILDKTLFSKDFIMRYLQSLPEKVKDEINIKITEYQSKTNIKTRDVIDFTIFLRNLYVNNIHTPEIIDLLLQLKKELKIYFDKKLFEKLEDKKINPEIFSELEVSHWYLEFCNAFFEDSNKGFDFIIGNPPYIFTKYRDIDKNEKDFYKKNFYEDYSVKGVGDRKKQSGKLNLFCLFLIKSIKLLKQNGVLGFIIPNGILRATTNDIDRKIILDTTRILKITDLGEGIFEDVTLSTILLFLQKETDMDKRNHNIVKIKDIKNFSNNIVQENFLKNVSYVFCIYLTTNIKRTFDKVKKLSDKLKIFTREYVEGIVCKADDYDYEENINLADPKKNWRPFLKGRDINRFEIRYKNRYINYIPSNLHRSREEWIFNEPQKIISQRITGGKSVLVAAIDESQHYTFSSFNNFIKKNYFTYNYYFFLGLFNSYLLNCFYRINYTNNSNLTVNISKTFLNHLPIYRVDFTNKRDRELYELIIKLSKEITAKKKVRQDMAKQFNKYLLQNNLDDFASLDKIFDNQYKNKMNSYLIDYNNSETFNEDLSDFIKEYQVNLIQDDFLLLLCRSEISTEYKPIIKIKFLDSFIKEFFFYSINIDTQKKKTYRSTKNVMETLKRDLGVRLNRKISIDENVKIMKTIISDLKAQFKTNLTDLNNNLSELEKHLNSAIFELYKLTDAEINILYES